MNSQHLRNALRAGLSRTRWGRERLEARRFRREAAQRERGSALYRGLMKPGDLCFDIGANVGNRTELLRDIGARVIAVEPQRLCAEELRRRFGDDTSVEIVATAVGNMSGTAEIAVCDDDPTISTMSKRWREEGRFANQDWSRTEKVEVQTLDQLIDTYGAPAFCKIDVEGFERQVMEGVSSPLSCVSFEFTHEFLDDARACVELLEALGPIEVGPSFGETMEIGHWGDPDAAFLAIEAEPDGLDWGDIYVRSLYVDR